MLNTAPASTIREDDQRQPTAHGFRPQFSSAAKVGPTTSTLLLKTLFFDYSLAVKLVFDAEIATNISWQSLVSYGLRY